VWLEDTVGSFSIEGDGKGKTLALELVPASEVPRLLRAKVFVSGPPLGFPNFLTLIQSQNKTLHTERGGFQHQQSTDKGRFFVWGIDQESACAIAAKNNQPHFGLGRITFRVRSQAGDEAGAT